MRLKMSSNPRKTWAWRNEDLRASDNTTMCYVAGTSAYHAS